MIRCVLLASALLMLEVSSGWRHLSSKSGALEPPNSGTQQTSATVFDIDGDALNDFVITERTAAPGIVWYRRAAEGWKRHVLEPEAVHIEAGATYMDVDRDGDLDFVAGGDWKLDQVCWWENPAPRFDDRKGWQRHVIKQGLAPKHHDLLAGDFDGDGREELVFWNQDAAKLLLARVPQDPRRAASWPLAEVYSYARDSEMEFRGQADRFKGVNEHEGLAKADVDLDGKLDIIGGGRWFKHRSGSTWEVNIVDAGYAFSRAAAGDLKKGGRPEIVLVVGDGRGPLLWYEWVKGTWTAHKLLDVVNGHTLDIVDFNRDGNLDIFCAEMRLDGGNPDSKIYMLLGDGQGNFKPTVVARGFGVHEGKIADLDGNGTLDILGKPYNWDTPRLDIWLSNPGAR